MQQFARVQQGDAVIPVFVNEAGLLDLRPLVSDITPEALASGVLTEVNAATLKPLMGEVSYLAPIHGVRQIPATGFNYKKHIDEMKVPTPTEPEVFLKSMFSLTGPYDPIQRGPNPRVKLDWETELAIVVGRELQATSASTTSQTGTHNWMRSASSTLCVQSRVRPTLRSGRISPPASTR